MVKNAGKRIFSWFLALAMLAGLIPILPVPAEAAGASESTGEGSGVTLTQTAQWDKSVPGGTTAKITLTLESDVSLQTPKDVVFVIDHAFLQDLNGWKTAAKDLADRLDVVDGMRYALVSYASSVSRTMDFTENVNDLKSAVDSIQYGYNCNGYAGLQAAKALIDGRSAPVHDACIVLFSDGAFNLNLALTESLGASIHARIPIYGVKSDRPTQPRMKNFCTSILNVYGLAMAIGESKVYRDVVITGGLGADFDPGSASKGTLNPNGTFTYRLPSYQLGDTLSLNFSGKLKDRNATGTFTAGQEVSVSGSGGLSVNAGAVSLERSGVTVTYKADGASGTVPKDSTRYAPNSEVKVKSADSLRKQGWNFSGWSNGQHVYSPDDSFTINQNTELDAVWGRGFVKIASSPVTSSNVHGSAMLSRTEIEEKYTADGKAFYNDTYWKSLDTVYLVSGESVPQNPDAGPWDITDTNIEGNDPWAVTAWVVKNKEDVTKYDLYINGQDGLSAPENSRSLFSICTAKEIVGLNNLNTSRVTVMASMFASCSNLTNLDLSRWNTSNVSDMNSMFYRCSKLTSLDLTRSGQNIWNTSEVTNMNSMFNGCSGLTSLDLNSWNTEKVTGMCTMFSGCKALKSLLIKKWNTAQVTNMNGMFYGCSQLTVLDISGWDTGNVLYMYEMFRECSNLVKLTTGKNWSTAKVTNMDRLFFYCISLDTLDVSSWSTENVTSMSEMFRQCRNLEQMDLSSWNTSKVKHMDGMFLFCSSLTGLTTGKDWSTAKVTDMSYMFCHCSKLTTLELRNWSTSAVTDMKFMFYECSGLTNLTLGHQWGTFEATDTAINMNSMFAGSGLISIDLSTWDMEKVGDVRYMFSECKSLTTFAPDPLTVLNGCLAEGFQCNSKLSTASPQKIIKIHSVSESGTLIDTKPYTTTTKTASPAMNQVNIPGLEESEAPEYEAPDAFDEPEFQPPDYNDPDSWQPDYDDPGTYDDPDSWQPDYDDPGTYDDPDSWWPDYDDPGTYDDPDSWWPDYDDPGTYDDPDSWWPDYDDPGTYDDPDSWQPDYDDPWAYEDEGSYFQTSYPKKLRGRKTLYASSAETDSDNRPLYADTKAGLWDCGQVEAGDMITYNLEVQYLNDEHTSGGVSGLLTVTNKIPDGLTYNNDATTPTVSWIDSSSLPPTLCAGKPGPVQFSNGVLSFTVKGLSAGGKCAIQYTCTVPENSGEKQQFLNTATVMDNGLADTADPVLHYMDAAKFVATYSYLNAPPDVELPEPESWPANETITLPVPVGEGFLGWKLDGSGEYLSEYTMDNNAHFVGEWAINAETVTVDYSQTGDLPENAESIWDDLMADTITEFPENANVTAPEMPVLPGYDFTWHYPDGLTVTDNVFNVKENADWPPDGVIHIEGVWEKKSYSVTYQYTNDPVDATGLPSVRQYLWGSQVELAAAPVSSSKLFCGWTSSDTEIGEKFTMPMQDVTITGDWAEKPVVPEAEREVKIDPNGGTWNGSATDTILTLGDYEKRQAEGNFPDAVKPDAVFDRWNDEGPQGLFAKVLTAVWKAPDPPKPPEPPSVYSVTFNSQGGSATDQQSVTSGGKAVRPADPTRSGYRFLGWFLDTSGSAQWDFNTNIVSENITLYARWEKTQSTPSGGGGGGGGGGSSYIITAEAGPDGTISPTGKVSVSGGSSKTFTIRPKAGYAIQDVLVDGKSVGKPETYTFKNVRANHTIKAAFSVIPANVENVLNTDDHFSYLHGFKDGRFRPNDNMTRGQVAQMFYNLLRDRNLSAAGSYGDVPRDLWCREAAEALRSMKIMLGVKGNRFEPNRPITRAEFVVTAMRFVGESNPDTAKTFSDVSKDNWFYPQVTSAAGFGWIGGYGDGTFRPYDPISRAEASKIVNRMLRRNADKAYIDSHSRELCQFSDVPASYWAYYDIMEAANAHDHKTENGQETWVRRRDT